MKAGTGSVGFFPNSQEETVRLQLEREERSAAAAKDEESAPPKISRGIDGELNTIVDLALRDYVLYW